MTKRAPCRDTPKKYLISSVHWTIYHMNEVYHGDRYIYNRDRDYRYPELWKDGETDWASWWNFHFTVRSPTTCFLLQPHFPSPILLHCVSNTNSLLGRWVVINNRIPSGWEATRKKNDDISQRGSGLGSRGQRTHKREHSDLHHIVIGDELVLSYCSVKC